MKAVLDTNVLLSAFLTDGICARILKRARRKHFLFILCAAVLKEVRRILGTKFSLNEREISLFISVLSESAEEVYRFTDTPPGVCRDRMMISCSIVPRKQRQTIWL